jgi:hypothetical protein
MGAYFCAFAHPADAKINQPIPLVLSIVWHKSKSLRDLYLFCNTGNIVCTRPHSCPFGLPCCTPSLHSQEARRTRIANQSFIRFSYRLSPAETSLIPFLQPLPPHAAGAFTLKYLYIYHMKTKKINASENVLNSINTNIFFKEFTFGFQNTIRDYNNQEIEVADNIVWLEKYCSVYQIKERNVDDKTISFDKWFGNKVLNKAVNQIKRRIKLLNSESEIIIKNNRGHERSLKNLPLASLKKIIIYNPYEEIENEYRFLKFKESKTVGLIHLFHLEDYKWISLYLVTPCEVY